MFVSPCTLRSTQCAALIALAAVAGIARVETSRSAPSPDQTSTARTHGRQSSQSLDRLVGFAAPTWTPAWLQPLASVALWFLSGNETRAPSELSTATTPPLPSAAHAAFPPAVAACLQPDLALVTAGLAHPAAPSPALCTRAHLIPFAVGPPARAVNLPHRAVGTAVPADDTVRCSSISPSALLFSCFVARLACLEFSGPSSVGPSFSPSSALRGKPARVSAPLDLRPSLGVSARPGRHSTLLFT